MTPPTRWLQDPFTSAELQRLLSAANAPEPLPLEVRRQTEHRLSVWLSLGPAAASLWGIKYASGKLPAGSSQLGAWLSRLAGYKITFVALTSLGVVGLVTAVYAPALFVGAAPERQITSVAQPASNEPLREATPHKVTPDTVRKTDVPATEAALAAPTTAPQNLTRSTRLTNRHAPGISHDLLAEAGDLQRIRALREPLLQLRELKRHRARFPEGQLKSERQLLQSQVLTQLGREQESCSVLRELLRSGTTGPYSELAEQRLLQCRAALHP